VRDTLTLAPATRSAIVLVGLNLLAFTGARVDLTRVEVLLHPTTGGGRLRPGGSQVIVAQRAEPSRPTDQHQVDVIWYQSPHRRRGGAEGRVAAGTSRSRLRKPYSMRQSER
jgi:hypothetical protein